MARRECRTCSELKPESDFYWSSSKGTYETECRSCFRMRMKVNYCPDKAKAYNAARYKRDKDAFRERQLQAKYGMSLDQYQELWEAQDGLCAICQKPETATWKGTLKHLAVDHDHKTGLVRGLLCSQCNQGLGRFMDDTSLLVAAIAYLGGEENSS